MEQYKTEELLVLYTAMLQMNSAPMRRVAVWELGRLGDARAAKPLMLAITGDGDWECRHYAVMAMANVGGPEDAARLRELAEGEYLSGDGADGAGPVPAGLAEHIREDIEFSAKCCAGEEPRPGDGGDQHGEWWRG